MKKILSLMIAAIMLIGCVSVSLAEEAPTGFTAELRLALQEDTVRQLMGEAEKADEMAKAITKLINSLSILLTSDGVDSEFFVNVNDEALINALVLKNTDGMLMYSNLFPNYAINTANEDGVTLNGIPELNIDKEKLLAEINETYQGIFNKITDSISDPEDVEDTFFNKKFTSRRVVNMTAKEIMALLNEALNELVKKEEMASLFEQLGNAGININVEDINSEIENPDEEEIPETSIEIFDNGTDMVMRIIATKSASHSESNGSSIGSIMGMNISSGSSESHEEKVTMLIGNIDGETVAHIEADEAQFDISANAETTNIVALLNAAGLPTRLDLTTGKKEYGTDIAFNISINDATLLSGFCGITNVSSMTGSVSRDTTKIISMQDLTNPESEGYSGFMTDVMTSIGGLLGKILQAVPEAAPIFESMQQPQ